MTRLSIFLQNHFYDFSFVIIKKLFIAIPGIEPNVLLKPLKWINNEHICVNSDTQKSTEQRE